MNPMPEVAAPVIPRADAAYTAIKDALFAFAWLPGDRFSENELAERFGFSRTPLREALFRLHHEGYVDVVPRSGWQVRPLDFQRIDELYDVRIVLEEAALARLTRREQRVIEAALSGLLETWNVAPSQRESAPPRVWCLDEQFHTGLVQAGANQEMVRVHGEVCERLRIVRRLDFTKSERIAATYAEHSQILGQLVRGRLADARRLLRAHIEESRACVHQITLGMLHAARSSGSPPGDLVARSPPGHPDSP
ncbi:MAG: GntR family transcriptional regulator [Thioalkalivibrionaceae bacterium]